MSCIHYKFFSKLDYDMVTFSGLDISLCDLKCKIMRKEKLKAANCDLQITNAQTKEGTCAQHVQGFGDVLTGDVADHPMVATASRSHILPFMAHTRIA